MFLEYEEEEKSAVNLLK
jgi:hypothetical protein